MGEVLIELDTLSYIARRHIIPLATNYINQISNNQSTVLNAYAKDVNRKLQKVIEGINKLQASKKSKESTLTGCQELREELITVSEAVTEVMKVLPKNPDFPDQSEFLNM